MENFFERFLSRSDEHHKNIVRMTDVKTREQAAVTRVGKRDARRSIKKRDLVLMSEVVLLNNFLYRINDTKVHMPDDDRSRRDLTLESIVEGKKMEAYVEHRTKDMHVCALCGNVGYKKTPMKCIGNSWICITCFHKLKDILNSMDAWDAEVQIEKEMSKKMDEGLGF